MNQDINNNDQLQEIKNYLFNNKNKELDCYTALGFKNGDNIIKRRGKSKPAIEKKLKKINKQSPFSLKFINNTVKQKGLPFIIESKQLAISYIKEKEEHAEKGNDHYKNDIQIDMEKIKQDKNSLLYQYQLMLDYIEQIEKSLGFSLEKSLEEILDKFLILKQKEKLEKQYEDKTKISNLRRIFNFKKKPLGLSVESYNLLSKISIESYNLLSKISIESYDLLSKIREDSVKILSDLSLRSAYDISL